MKDTASPSSDSIPPQTAESDGPDSPTELGAAAWRQTLQRALKKFARDRCSVVAGNLAYRGFLALFPAVIALIGIEALIHLDPPGVNRLVHGVDKALPAGASTVLTAAVTEATKRSSGSTTAVIIGLLIGVWSASSAMAALQTGLDVAYEVPTDRKFLAKRLRALPLMLIALILGGLASGLLIFGAPLGAAVEPHVGLSGSAFTAVWTVVRWPLGIVAMSLLFSIFYYVGPNRDSPRWQWVSGGGLLATLIFVVASLGFSFYVANFGSYGKTYGAFAGVVIVISDFLVNQTDFEEAMLHLLDFPAEVSPVAAQLATGQDLAEAGTAK